MNLRTCADCSTRYAVDLAACPHCGGKSTQKAELVNERLPLFVAVTCPVCYHGPRTIRLESKAPGFIELPNLACASCGSQVPISWPPEKEEPMSPKITVKGGATNARETDVSPAVVASEPQVVAEDDLGHPTPQEAPEPEVEETVSYDGMTLAELRAAAEDSGLPTYGTKAQLIERLKNA